MDMDMDMDIDMDMHTACNAPCHTAGHAGDLHRLLTHSLTRGHAGEDPVLVTAVTEADTLEAGGERHGLVDCGEFRQAAQHINGLGPRVDHAPTGRLQCKYSPSKYSHAPTGRLYSIVHLVRGDDGSMHEEALSEETLRLLPRVGVGGGGGGD